MKGPVWTADGDLDEPWYAVRCHFLHPPGLVDRRLYEERITLWRAESFEQAADLAATEAREYAAANDAQFLDAWTIFHLHDTGFGVAGMEVFSEMRESELDPPSYLKRFFFTDDEPSR